MKNLLKTSFINIKNLLIAFFIKMKNLLITFFRNKKNLLIPLYNNYIKLLSKNISKLKDLSFLFTSFVSIILTIWLRPQITKFLSSYIAFMDSKYEYLLSYLVYFPSYVISYIIVTSISCGIITIIKELKNKSIKKKEVKFESEYSKLEFFIFSMEDLEAYANNNGIHHKVPEALWIEYRAAKDSCSTKGFNAKITEKLLKIRVKKYNNFIDLYNRILNLLNK